MQRRGSTQYALATSADKLTITTIIYGFQADYKQVSEQIRYAVNGAKSRC